MGERPKVVRSYQRVFAPDRRIYAIDGRTLPIPGGIPMRWLGTATVVVVAVLLLTSLRPIVVLVLAAVVGAGVRRLGRRRPALVAAACTAVGCVVAGLALRAVDWPLRLVVVPAVAATATLQLAPDGRSAHRFLLSWLRARVAGRRRLGHPLPTAGERAPVTDTRVVVAPDCHSPRLSRAQISGRVTVRLTSPVTVHSDRRGRRTIRPLNSQRRGGGVMLDEIEVADGERLRVRP